MASLKKCKVLVTPTSFGKTDPSLFRSLEQAVGQVVYNTSGRPLSSQEVGELLPGCDGYIAGLDVIDQAALEAADRLKVIARYGVGVDNVDLKAARRKNIIVTNTPDANSTSVAELTIGLMLSLARHIPEAVASTRSGGWPRMPGISLEGKTVGLVGLGSVGKKVASRLAGFDCRVLAHEPYPDLTFAQAYCVNLVPLDELLIQSEIVSLHLPLAPETRQLVNKGFLQRMKPGSFLVNTARGELVDEDALAEALRKGRLCGAALDVFSQEPPATDNPLLALPRVLITPHCASHTDGAMNAMGGMALEDCLAVLRGQLPKFPIC